jgi:K+ transporter
MKHHPLPETSSRKQKARARRKHTEHVLLAVVFTAVELWAVVATVVLLDDGGVLAVAVSAVLSAAMIAVWDTWKSVFATARSLRSPVPEEEPPAAEVDPEMKLVRV